MVTNRSKNKDVMILVVDVSIKPTEQGSRYVISDNGIGFDVNSPHLSGEYSGWGLLSMKERATTYDAEFNIHSETGKGTTITIDVKTE